ASLEVAADDAMEFEGHGQAMGSGACQSGQRHQFGERGGSGLKCGENHCGLVDDPDAATIACHRPPCACLSVRDASSKSDTSEKIHTTHSPHCLNQNVHDP